LLKQIPTPTSGATNATFAPPPLPRAMGRSRKEPPPQINPGRNARAAGPQLVAVEAPPVQPLPYGEWLWLWLWWRRC
jgi:hypothetical protein